MLLPPRIPLTCSPAWGPFEPPGISMARTVTVFAGLKRSSQAADQSSPVPSKGPYRTSNPVQRLSLPLLSFHARLFTKKKHHGRVGPRPPQFGCLRRCLRILGHVRRTSRSIQRAHPFARRPDRGFGTAKLELPNRRRDSLGVGNYTRSRNNNFT